MSLRRTLLGWVFVLFLLAGNAVLLFLLTREDTGLLTVSFLDVGQGDAILIQGPTGSDVLVDGGPDRSVLRELAGHLGPLDRHLDMVIATHPDKDHIAGLADVLLQYDVDTILTPGLAGDTDIYDQFVEAVGQERDVVAYVAQQGERVHLGGGAYVEILYPNKDVSHLRETNNASIIVRVVYGEASFLLTGDAPSEIEEELVRTLPAEALLSDVLKAGHHGSKYSTSALWLKTVSPRMVVISAGKGNTYGHPAPEVLRRVEQSGAALVSTIEEGTITYTSDGVSIWKE